MKFLKYGTIGLITLMIIGFIIIKSVPINLPLNIGKAYEGELPLEKLRMPEGFGINVWAEDIDNARSMDYSPSGTLFVGTRSKGNVYALKDTDGDGKSDKKWTIYRDGKMPNGVAFKDGDLYVAEVSRILKFEDIESKLDNPGEPIVVYDQYPTETHHGWKYIAFGPDGKLYVPVGAPCNICESEEPVFNSITRLNPDGTDFEILHRGVRNTVGFDWHPVSGDLWFTDNGRDRLGDEKPECELNHAPETNMHFGYPYCHQGDIPDPEFGEKKNCSEFTPPALKLGPHTAPLGMEFYKGSNFPKEYINQIFIARHGSWNRSKKIGYDLVRVKMSSDGKAAEYVPFISGWLDEESDDVWGRPVDVEVLPDGTMLLSDDFADVIYRIYFK
jgi:glucose/arabinose dehydrogenase